MTTINTMQDFSKLLREHPDWRDEVRRLLLTDELIELPQRFAEYAEETDKHSDSIDVRLDALVKQAEASNRRLDAIERDVGEIKGIALQNKLQHVGVGHISTAFRLRNGHALRMSETNRNSVEFNKTLLNAEEENIISEDDYDRLMVTDLIVRGNIRGTSTIVYAPIEATYRIHRADISKVNRSVAALRKVFPDADVRGALYYQDAVDYIEDEAREKGIRLIKETSLA